MTDTVLPGMTLRIRLLFSYLLLLALSLGVMTSALLVFISAQPAPAEPTYERLAALVQGLNIRDIALDIARMTNSPVVRFTEVLGEFSSSRGVRVMVVRLNRTGQTVLYDSSAAYAPGGDIVLSSDTYSSARLEPLLAARASQLYGAFSDPDGSEWLYGGILNSGLVGGANHLLLLAEAQQPVSLQVALQAFGSSLLPPLLQAGLLGLLVAVLLALWISRSIARPLQGLARAASQVAQGQYGDAVPVSGPHELRLVARSFNRMSTQVRLSQQAQRDFLANVSHDLKTPLTSIQGYSQAIIDGTARDPGQAAAIIHDEAERLNRMVTQLTDLVRIQSGGLAMKKTAIDMAGMTQAIAQRLAVVAQQKGVELHIEAAPVPQIAGDGDRLVQVLTNLMSNAIKFTPAGGRVVVRTAAADGGVTLSVQDTGIGIPQEDLARIFERFYQADKVRGPARGAGLGLAIVNEIVLAHGGRISALSAGPGQGATFTVWLPALNPGANNGRPPAR